MNRLKMVLRLILVLVPVLAILAYQAAIALGAGMSSVFTLNASDAKSLDDDETYLWSLQEAVRADPNDYHAWYRLATEYMEQNDAEKAREAFEACLELAPGHIGSLLGMVEVSSREGDYEAADRYLERSILVAPTSWRVYMGAGTMETRRGNTDKAIEYLRKADQLSRYQNVSIYNQMGIAYIEGDRPEEALAAAKTALAAAAGDGYANLVAGKSLLALGRASEALPALRTASAGLEEGTSTRGEARLQLALAYAKLGNFVQATTIARDESRTFPGVPEVLETIDQISAAVDAALAEGGGGKVSRPEIFCNLGYAYAAAGSLSEALARFEAAADTGAELEQSCVWARAETLLRLERYEESVVVYLETIRMGHAPLEMRVGLAEALTKLDRKAEARTQYVILLDAYQMDSEQRSRVEGLLEALQ